MGKKLSGTVFILSQILLLIFGLIFIGWLYFFLQDQNPINSFDNKPLTSEPASLTLEVSAPEDDLLSFEDEILISGKTQKNSQILISSQEHDEIAKANTAGDFSTNFPLEIGVNTITIAVFDPTGDQRTVEKTVYYSEEKI